MGISFNPVWSPLYSEQTPWHFNSEKWQCFELPNYFYRSVLHLKHSLTKNISQFHILYHHFSEIKYNGVPYFTNRSEGYVSIKCLITFQSKTMNFEINKS